jgi:hypothetical protein
LGLAKLDHGLNECSPIFRGRHHVGEDLASGIPTSNCYENLNESLSEKRCLTDSKKEKKTEEEEE